MEKSSEKSSFVLVFGNSPFVKIMDFFLNFEDFDYSIAQIAKETKTKWDTTEKVLIELIKRGVVKKTRKVGKSWLYVLNKENNLTKLLIQIDKKISNFFIEKELGRQRMKVVSR